jgi:hypothetical protein
VLNIRVYKQPCVKQAVAHNRVACTSEEGGAGENPPGKNHFMILKLNLNLKSEKLKTVN